MPSEEQILSMKDCLEKEQKKERPKLAIIGVGRWGKVLLKEFVPLANIIAYSNKSNLDNINYMNENYPQIERRSEEEILKDESIEGVIISVPIAHQNRFAVRAAQYNKHIFLEKPGFGAPSAANISNDKVVFVGYRFLYEPFLRKLNDCSYLSFYWQKFGTFKEDIAQNLACHDIASAIKIFGSKPIDVDVVQISKHTLKLGLLFSENRFASIDIDRTSGRTAHYVIEGFGKKHNLVSSISVHRECSAFIECIKGNEEPAASLDLVKGVLDVLKQVAWSSR